MKDPNLVALYSGLKAVLAYLEHQDYENNIVGYLIVDLLDLGPQSKKKLINLQNEIYERLISMDEE